MSSAMMLRQMREGQESSRAIADELWRLLNPQHQALVWTEPVAVSLGAANASVQEQCLRAVSMAMTWYAIIAQNERGIPITDKGLRANIIRVLARCAELHVRSTRRELYDLDFTGWVIPGVLVGHSTHLQMVRQPEEDEEEDDNDHG
jgi:hypothetical protein